MGAFRPTQNDAVTALRAAPILQAVATERASAVYDNPSNLWALGRQWPPFNN